MIFLNTQGPRLWFILFSISLSYNLETLKGTREQIIWIVGKTIDKNSQRSNDVSGHWVCLGGTLSQQVAPGMQTNAYLGGKMSHSTDTQLTSHTWVQLKCGNLQRPQGFSSQTRADALPVLLHCEIETWLPGQGARFHKWNRFASKWTAAKHFTQFTERLLFYWSGLRSNCTVEKKWGPPLSSSMYWTFRNQIFFFYGFGGHILL